MTGTTVQLNSEELKDLMEHSQVLKDIVVLLTTPSGERFIKYLFKHFEVTELPPIGFTGELMYDKLGSLRPGRLLFKLISQADPANAGRLLAMVEREKTNQEKINATNP